MNNRLTIKDLAGILSKKSDRDADTLEYFLKEFVAVVRENVFADNLMQVKGIGTFKILQVESRESVDVNTKERIVIPSHSKMSFTPDKEMKETVNKPFSFFESIEINDDSEFTSFESSTDDKYEEIEEAEEFEDTENILEEIGEKKTFIPPTIKKDPKNEVDVQGEPEEQEEISIYTETTLSEETKTILTEENEHLTEEPDLLTEEPEPLKEETVLYMAEKHTQIETGEKEVKEKEIISNMINQVNEDNMNDYNDNKRGRDTYTRTGSGSNNILVTLLLALVVILIIALGSILFLNRNKLFGGDDTVSVTKEENPQNHFSLPGDEDLSADGAIEDEWGVEDEYAQENPASTTTSSGKENVIATITTKRGDRLNLLALEYYGNKLFWVYIYEYNESKINNPDNIDIGITLDIPVKSVYNIDANDPASVERASVKQTEIMSKYKPKRRRRSSSSYNQYRYNDSYMYQYSDPGLSGNSLYNDPSLNAGQYSNDAYSTGSSQYNDNTLYDNNSFNSYNNNDMLNNNNTYSDPFYF